MGLDFGEKTIGVAISDPLLLVAGGIEIIRRSEEVAIKKSIARLGEIIKQYEVNCIVLGFPKNMDNSISERCEKTLDFQARLNRNFKKIPVRLWDERLSTVASDRILFELSKTKRKDYIDKIAAVYILQGYLDFYNKNIKGV